MDPASDPALHFLHSFVQVALLFASDSSICSPRYCASMPGYTTIIGHKNSNILRRIAAAVQVPHNLYSFSIELQFRSIARALGCQYDLRPLHLKVVV